MKEVCVSVIIPTYGRPDKLIFSISSVLEQTYDNIEIIVVDDNGRDTNNQLITKRLLEEHELFTKVNYLILEFNSGGGLARNAGMEIAKGDYITFLDDDDIYFPDKIEKQLRGFKGNVEMVAIGTELRLEESRGKNIYPRGSTPTEFLLDGLIMTPMIMIKKSAYQKGIKFLDIPRMQDHTFVLNFILAGLSYTILDDIGYIHHAHLGERITNSSKGILAIPILESLEKEVANKLGLSKNEFTAVELKNDILKIEGVLNSSNNSLTISNLTQVIRIMFKSIFNGKFKVSCRLLLRITCGDRLYSSIKKKAHFVINRFT
ncbi:glycosyltransferase family 2 protein [Vibrio breoganii]|uniref:glycosyltransferase family 2 protein n=1 Tax=Vibrio breoganii TaxID=553239 RepID=UPI00036680BF|nr:glycosyltransferase family 2 protein [Vibrio breoganii]